jgi:hypothetical protein
MGLLAASVASDYLRTVAHVIQNTHATGSRLRKAFDMKYVAGYHLESAGVKPAFLLAQMRSRNCTFRTYEDESFSALIRKPEKFDSHRTLVTRSRLKNGLGREMGCPLTSTLRGPTLPLSQSIPSCAQQTPPAARSVDLIK